MRTLLTSQYVLLDGWFHRCFRRVRRSAGCYGVNPCCHRRQHGSTIHLFDWRWRLQYIPPMTWCNGTPGRIMSYSALFPGIDTTRRIRVPVMETVTHACSFNPVFKVLSSTAVQSEIRYSKVLCAILSAPFGYFFQQSAATINPMCFPKGIKFHCGHQITCYKLYCRARADISSKPSDGVGPSAAAKRNLSFLFLSLCYRRHQDT